MRILVVEDQKQILNFVKKGLQAEGFAVDGAKDGERGSFLARTNDYDLVILDVRLPKKNGVKICQELREAEKTFPIIMLSVIDDTKSKVKALNAGADDYLTKPFSFEELLARVRALLRRGKEIIGDTIELDGLVLDSAAHTVSRAGKPIELTRKEFTLLEYFMRNPGVVLTRGMILEHVWDMDTDPFTNTVDVHVRALRKKFDEKRRHKFIQTVHGYGYKFEPKRAM